MFLDEQILAVLRRALREDKLEVADHLWKAAEALVEECEYDRAAQRRVRIEEIDRVVSEGLQRKTCSRPVQLKRLRHTVTKH